MLSGGPSIQTELSSSLSLAGAIATKCAADLCEPAGGHPAQPHDHSAGGQGRDLFCGQGGQAVGGMDGDQHGRMELQTN